MDSWKWGPKNPSGLLRIHKDAGQRSLVPGETPILIPRLAFLCGKGLTPIGI